jgi:arylsulfatase A-like enzyme
VSEWLTGDYGIVRGFDEELVTKRAKNHYRPAREALKPLYSSLKAHGAGPMFVFSHLLDAHAPHNFGRKDGTVYERYLSELEVVDRAVGELVKELERRKLWDRTCFLLYSDHGEGFGEHQSTFHGYGLYDELQHVPLLVRIPGLAPQRIDQRVSLIDVGPTILDLAGLPTPGSYMGQSLVPLLAGSRDELARPMFSEARLKHGLVLPDGRKLIHDTRLRSVELYDLNRDPGELHNLYDDDDPEHVRLLSLVKRFFAVHTLKRPGYRVPFRRW